MPILTNKILHTSEMGELKSYCRASRSPKICSSWGIMEAFSCRKQFGFFLNKDSMFKDLIKDRIKTVSG